MKEDLQKVGKGILDCMDMNKIVGKVGEPKFSERWIFPIRTFSRDFGICYFLMFSLIGVFVGYIFYSSKGLIQTYDGDSAFL